MIINLLINLILLIFGAIFLILPEVSIADIPYVGFYIDDYLTFAVTTWNGFLDTFPYAQTAWHMFLVIILPFEILMLIAKFFLGHRTPQNIN